MSPGAGIGDAAPRAGSEATATTSTAPAGLAAQDFDDDTRDALGEAFNLALGEASAHFAELVNDEILLSVPAVERVDRDGLLRALRPGVAEDAGALCRIEQHFHCARREIATTAALLFPERGSLEIVREMLGCDSETSRLGELEQDALAEIGNIIINSCMNSLARLLDREMVGSLPDVRVGPAERLFAGGGPGDGAMLLARVEMRMARRRISGHVLFTMDLASLSASIRLIRRFFGLAEVGA